LNASEVVAGRYRLERLLGTGGVAEVWLAQDTRLERWVAVKCLKFDGQNDPEMHAAFAREARVVAKLQHPNIVAVYDSGSHEGREFIVMEYVHGYTLRELLETQTRFPEQEAIRYGVQVATALQYAHTQGVVHCDVKPENILVNEAGVAKVADFGVAEALNRTMAPGQAQDLLGTVAYLAPEIIEGSTPSPASDIYSLGLTVFELVAGRLPFSGTSPGATIGQRLATPATPLRALARGASPELEAVLSRALALSAQDRYPTAAAFGAALQRVPQPGQERVAPVAVPPGRAPAPPARRHTTSRISRTQRAGTAGMSGATALLVAGIVLAAAGVGIAAAVLISRSGDDAGGATTTPTATTASVTAQAASPTPKPTNKPTEAAATATQTQAATETATSQATATNPAASPSAPPSPSATITPKPSSSPATTPTATKTP
jgi:serine/threonine-protein kinase